MQLKTSDEPTAASAVALPSAVDDGVIIIAGRRYLTLERFARSIGKSVRTVARWNQLRFGPPLIKIGNLSLIDEEKLPGWFAGHERNPVRSARRCRSGGAHARPTA